MEEEEVLKAVKSYANGDSGGASCLTPQHLLDGILCSSPLLQERAITALTTLVNVMVAAEAPECIACYVAGAPLTALKKGDGGGQPIAV